MQSASKDSRFAISLQVSKLMTEFDKDESSELTFEEFYELARFQMGLRTGRWHQSIWFRIVRKWTLKSECNDCVWEMHAAAYLNPTHKSSNVELISLKIRHFG